MDRKWVVRCDSELLPPVGPQGVESWPWNSLRKGLHDELDISGRRKSRAVAHQREGLVSRGPLVEKQTRKGWPEGWPERHGCQGCTEFGLQTGNRAPLPGSYCRGCSRLNPNLCFGVFGEYFPRDYNEC